MVRIAEEDADAFAAFYDRHAPNVLGYLTRLLRSRTEAEDVLQAAFLQVWRKAPSFDPSRGAPRAWLYLIARSRAFDALRRQRATASIDRAPEPGAEVELGRGLEQAEASERVRDALGQLPENHRSAIRLAFFFGLTHTDVAERLEVPLGTAKTWIRRGMQQMRDILEGRQEVSA